MLLTNILWNLHASNRAALQVHLVRQNLRCCSSDDESSDTRTGSSVIGELHVVRLHA